MSGSAFSSYFAIALLILLGVTVALDPRTANYRSGYSPPAPEYLVKKWKEDLKQWRKSPTWERFREGAKDPLGPPDFARSYYFGKYNYRIDLQIRGTRIQYISWGTDDQLGGGAWYSVGEGKLQPSGEYFSVWSCLDLSRAISNGGGAWFSFNRDRSLIDVRYYHDTLPFGESPIELGEAVAIDSYEGKLLEGRITTRVRTVFSNAETPYRIWGRVVDEQGEGISNAAVKRRGHGRIETVTDARGFFRLELEKVEALTLLSAGKLGYYNGIITLDQDATFRAIGRSAADAAFATIELRRMTRTDHRDYKWISPEPLIMNKTYSPEKHLQCANCHARQYKDWKTSRHATMAINPWTKSAFEKDARPSALAAGVTRDNCTPCHSPSLASQLDRFDLRGRTLLDADGVHKSGNHCDFCHKIEAVPDPYAPGVNGSLRLLRPDPKDDTVPGNIKLLFGPLPDVSFLYMGAGYNPIFEMGLLCASCHEHTTESGLHGQNTWSEWKQTKYSKPGKDYRECQSCHMPHYKPASTKPDEAEIAVAGTRRRPWVETHAHTFRGSEDADFVKEAITMKVKTRRYGGRLQVTVTLENVGAGHAIPTGHGLKRYLLAVFGAGEAADSGVPRIPEAEQVGELTGAIAGVVIGRKFRGRTLAQALAGRSGRTEDWSIPWWRADKEVTNSALMPGKPRSFVLELVNAGEVTIKLVLRRGSPKLLNEHGLEGNSVAGTDRDRVVLTWTGR